MKIAVWSPTPYAGRKSTHLLLLALQAVSEEGGEQLIIHADPFGSGPEHFLLSGNHRRRMMEHKEFGLELLCRLLHCEHFSKEAVVNASYTFAEGKLHVLPPGHRCFYEGKEAEVAKELSGILQYAGEAFQNVWVELPAGESEISTRILSEADYVLINLPQRFCDVTNIEKLPVFQREMFLFGAYEQRCVYTMHNMMLLFPRLRGKCGVIPYHPGYLAACCAGEAERFWMRGQNSETEKDSEVFFRTVKKTYDKWKAEVTSDYVEITEKEGERKKA